MVIDGFKMLGKLLFNVLDIIVDIILLAFQCLLEIIWEYVSPFVKAVVHWFYKLFEEICKPIEAIQEFLVSCWNTAKEKVLEIVDGIVSGVKNKFFALVDNVKSAFNTLKGIWNKLAGASEDATGKIEDAEKALNQVNAGKSGGKGGEGASVAQQAIANNTVNNNKNTTNNTTNITQTNTFNGVSEATADKVIAANDRNYGEMTRSVGNNQNGA